MNLIPMVIEQTGRGERATISIPGFSKKESSLSALLLMMKYRA